MLGWTPTFGTGSGVPVEQLRTELVCILTCCVMAAETVILSMRAANTPFIDFRIPGANARSVALAWTDYDMASCHGVPLLKGSGAWRGT